MAYSYYRRPQGKRIQLIIQGQSNEAGTTTRFITTAGTGINTSADGSLSAGSWAQRLAELIGARDGHIVSPVYDAYGSTSMLAAYTGFCRTWAAGVWYTGQIVLSDGGVWILNEGITGGSKTATAGNGPTGTANVTTADGLNWKYVGPAGERDTVNRVYEYTDTGRFDPLGRMAAQSGANLLSGASNYDLRIGLNSWAQHDSSFSAVTRDVYKQGLISLTDFALSRGLDAYFIGLSCYYPAQDAQYTSKLTPAVEDALAYYAGNPKVFRGVNARTELGALPTSPATGIPGLRADAIHANEAAQIVWAKKWYDRIKASGILDR